MGQLWQECEICGTEPVCSDCFRCHDHCNCNERERVPFSFIEMLGKIDDAEPYAGE